LTGQKLFTDPSLGKVPPKLGSKQEDVVTARPACGTPADPIESSLLPHKSLKPRDRFLIFKMMDTPSPFATESSLLKRYSLSSFEEPSSPTHVNVQYILGSSKRKRVPMDYVTLATQYEVMTSAAAVANNNYSNSNSLRDQSRCGNCPVLATD
jgi:hypothetical protein